MTKKKDFLIGIAALALLAFFSLSGLVVANEVGKPAILVAESFRHYVDSFNRDDEQLYANIPNKKAWEFLKANIPLFECPDKDFEQTYYFRWWTYRKHVKKTPDGFVITEFLPKVPALDAKGMRGRRVKWKDWFPPALLLEFKGAGGRSVRLCDYGSAGEAGTPYVSWLPVKNAPGRAAGPPAST